MRPTRIIRGTSVVLIRFWRGAGIFTGGWGAAWENQERCGVCVGKNPDRPVAARPNQRNYIQCPAGSAHLWPNTAPCRPPKGRRPAAQLPEPAVGPTRRALDREALRTAVHGVAKSLTRPSDWLNWTEGRPLHRQKPRGPRRLSQNNAEAWRSGGTWGPLCRPGSPR